MSTLAAPQKGRAQVHSFESFGTVDGPGVRFVIFFQGCHLRCQYCHNRDLWDFDGGKEYSALDLFNEVKKYKPFFTSSGGGLTVSGGDPIMQAPVVTELFKLCKAAGIHTALDTSGAVAITPEIKELLAVTDLVLLDLKDIRPAEHLALTGIDNSLTLAFAQFLSAQNIPTWIRHVVVPTLTDSHEQCRELASFIGTLSSVEKVELLPFHKMGEYKWEELNKGYELHGIEAPTQEELSRVKAHFSELTIPVTLPQ